MFKIDDDIPMPVDGRPGRRGQYPWKRLTIGQSFFVPGRTPTQISGSVTTAKRATGYQFVTRTVTENGVRGVRVWRLE